MSTRVFWHQVRVLTQPVTGALDLHDDGVVQEAVEERGCHHRIPEYVAPFGKSPIGGQDHRSLFVSGIDQLEKQIGAAAGDRQVSDFIDDQ